LICCCCRQKEFDGNPFDSVSRRTLLNIVHTRTTRLTKSGLHDPLEWIQLASVRSMNRWRSILPLRVLSVVIRSLLVSLSEQNQGHFLCIQVDLFTSLGNLKGPRMRLHAIPSCIRASRWFKVTSCRSRVSDVIDNLRPFNRIPVATAPCSNLAI
jgi:hypothetical protein